MARAIVHAPAVLLFDEPLSNLDTKLRDQTRAEIRKLQRDLNVATVYVTHDQAEALSLSDRILVMRSGIIRQQGTPLEVYGNPLDMFVADVVGPANFLPVTARNGATVLADGTVVHAVGSGPGMAMIRPDRLFVGGMSDNALSGTVKQRLYLGGHYEYLVAVGPSLLRVLSSVTVTEGSTVALSFAAADCIILPAIEGGTTPWA